ncbi:MAG: hypothetical protein K0R26_773 [Bacteroidota bacterium]|jgi:hypothetical protein|nr:hypothetical protein [Bacteroidota bacterium]
MKKNRFLIGLLFSFILGAFLFSCKKKEKEEKDTDTGGAADQSLATSIANDMTNISDEAAKTYSISSFKTQDTKGLLAASCASLTVDTILAAKTITVNFGVSNCVCNDGRTRRGSLIIAFTGKYRDSLTEISVTPVSYYVNDNQVTGTKTIVNKGHNTSHHLVYEINANLQIVKANNGGTISWQSVRQREWISGENTQQWNDDIYSITGSASGTTSNGNSFNSIISSPLIRKMSFGCRRHFTQGVLEHTPGGKATRYIDFGNGTCDDQATVTINGNTYIITLP